MSDIKNFNNQEAISKLQELVNDINICLFCTNLKTDDGSTCRPMSVQNVCDQGNLWFFSPKDSDKNREIEGNSQVQLFFSSPEKSSFLVVNGEAEVIINQQKNEELWTPLVKAWFPEGKDDPNLSIIKVTPSSAYYWDTDGNRMINFFKMVASAVTGTNLVTSKEGSLSI